MPYLSFSGISARVYLSELSRAGGAIEAVKRAKLARTGVVP
jgi:hypothetical protein